MSISSDAKDIATYFVNSTNMKASKSLMSRTIVQAKSLLSDGFTKDEIIKTIDYVINVKKVDLHSFGYINVVISDMLLKSLNMNPIICSKCQRRNFGIY